MEEQKTKRKKNKIGYFFLTLALMSTLALFGGSIYKGVQEGIELENLIILLLSTVFVIFFIFTAVIAGRKGKNTTLLASITLIIMNCFELALQFNLINMPNQKLENFTSKSLTEVVKYAEKNNIELTQIYEYSDMIEEYKIIGQNIESGTNLKKVKKLTVAVSEGANPDKEVIIPNMLTWSDEAVIKFVKENNLNNVEVEFTESAKLKNTVIEQEGTGNRKRSDLLKLTFSLGEKEEITDTKLIDLTNKSKFEAEFWLKQHAISYEIEKDFSSKVKRDYTVKQSEKPGILVKPNETKIKLTISKGPKIKVPDLKKMSMTELTEWIIKNKLKIEFTDQYDDKIKDNHVIKANYNKGDIIEQKTLISITLSKGKLKMPKLNTLDEIKSWAEKYGISYQEEYEFDSLVKKGEIIKTSHKEGETIKNGETIIITISQGKKTKVPRLTGLKKQEVIKKLKEADLNYNFVYEDNEKIEKDTVIAQSMKEGSEVSENTTITITLSTGKKKTNANNTGYVAPNKNQEKPNNNNTNNNNNNTNNNTNNTQPTCKEKTYTVGSSLRNVFMNNEGYSAMSNALYSYFASNYPNVKISVIGVADTGMSAGQYVSGIKPGSKITSCNTTPYTISIAK